MGDFAKGAALGAKLEDLVRVANAQLPQVEDGFQRVYGGLQRANSMISGAFRRHADFGGGADRDADVMMEFTYTIMDCVKESQESIAMTGDALRLAAQEYAHSDAEAERTLRSLMKNDVFEDQYGNQHQIPDLPL